MFVHGSAKYHLYFVLYVTVSKKRGHSVQNVQFEL